MIEPGGGCSEVPAQLSAADPAIRGTMGVILKEHALACTVDAVKAGDRECLEELAGAAYPLP